MQATNSVTVLKISPTQHTSGLQTSLHLLCKWQPNPRSRDPPCHWIPHSPPHPKPLSGYHRCSYLRWTKLWPPRGIDHVPVSRAKTVALRLEELSHAPCVTIVPNTLVQGSERSRRPAFLVHYTRHLQAHQIPAMSTLYSHSMTYKHPTRGYWRWQPDTSRHATGSEARPAGTGTRGCYWASEY